MSRWFSTLVILLTSAINAADGSLTIAGPSTADPKESIELLITGLTDAELRQATVASVPSKGVTLLSRRSWSDNQPIVVFKAAASGQYTVTIAYNVAHIEWRRSLEASLSAAKVANVDSKLLTEFTGLSSRLAVAYPVKSASVSVTVGSVVIIPPAPPTPVPTPTPTPPPVTSGLVYFVVIRTAETLTANQSQVLSDLREWSDVQPSSKISHFEFPPDAEDDSGNLDPKVASYVRQIPASSKQPYLFVAQVRSDGKSVILYQSELPASAATVIAKMGEFVR